MKGKDMKRVEGLPLIPAEMEAQIAALAALIVHDFLTNGKKEL